MGYTSDKVTGLKIVCPICGKETVPTYNDLKFHFITRITVEFECTHCRNQLSTEFRISIPTRVTREAAGPIVILTMIKTP